jgi:hypothetical protein
MQSILHTTTDKRVEENYVIFMRACIHTCIVKFKSKVVSATQINKINELAKLQHVMQLDPKTYLRSPSTSGRSLVIAITNAKNVTKVVIKTTGELQVETYKKKCISRRQWIKI